MSNKPVSPQKTTLISQLLSRSWLGTMWRFRELTLAMTHREIADRYVGQVLGPLWAIGHPLLLILIYLTVFAFILNIKTGMGPQGDYVLYMLSGIVPWMTVQDALLRNVTVVVVHSGLVKQVAFPLEILPVKTLLAALLNQLVSTMLLVGYILWNYGSLSFIAFLWPLLFAIQFVGLLGIGYLLATAGVFLRDLKDVLLVYCTASLYCMPVFYNLDQIPGWARAVVLCNPFTHLLLCYQDIFFYQQMTHVSSWVGVSVASLGLFGVGLRTFQKTRSLFGNVL